jgi:hypothetical protein
MDLRIALFIWRNEFMRDFAAQWAEVEAAEADVRSAIDRFVALILSDEPISSKAGAAVANVDLLVGAMKGAAPGSINPTILGRSS